MTVDALFAEAERLPPPERRALAERLFALDDPPLSDALRTELDRRCAELDANPEIGIPWEVVKEAALRRARS